MERYCKKCGQKLSFQKANAIDVTDGQYHPLTGKQTQIEVFILKCPNKKWWNSHDEYVTDKNGNGLITITI